MYLVAVIIKHAMIVRGNREWAYYAILEVRICHSIFVSTTNFCDPPSHTHTHTHTHTLDIYDQSLILPHFMELTLIQGWP